jgi:cytochrome c peroxidase
LPLDGRAARSKTPMTEQQANDLICFLRTLSDTDVVASNAPAASLNCVE